MSGLRRNASTPRLLSVVQNRNWATEADHEDPALQQCTTGRRSVDTNKPQIDEDDEDINRDPDSDSDSDRNDKENTKSWRLPSPKTKIRAPRKSGRVARVNIHTESTKKVQSKAVQPECGTSDPLHDEAEENIFGSSQPSQSSQKRSRGKATYGKGIKKPRTDTREKRNGDEAKLFLRPSVHQSLQSVKSEAVGSEADAPVRAVPLFRRPQEFSAGSAPATTDTPISPQSSASPSLCTYTPEPDDIIQLDLQNPSINVENEPCPICGEEVETGFRSEFQARQCRGKRMNFRLQELFCKTHKERSARRIWQDRDYPEIDWGRLHRRFERHNQRILDVISGKVQSGYEEELEERLRSGQLKTTHQTLDNEAQTGTHVGYYGSRGEVIMRDYIMNTFKSELRRSGISNKVVTAVGASGGIPGYVQSVLVPELALELVMEDADCDKEEARRIIMESSEIGEALHEAEEEEVPQNNALSARAD
ncbi:RTC4-like domain-containing protein [Delphinella strobiligena]|nr:RTC4-like domain-containing protein [Delphinella strobiligena]